MKNQSPSSADQRVRALLVLAVALLLAIVGWRLYAPASIGHAQPTRAQPRTEPVSTPASLRARASNTAAEPALVRGRVTSGSGTPLAAVVCITAPMATGGEAPPCVVTDRSGSFELHAIESGSHVVSASATGHLPKRRVFEVPNDLDKRLDLVLEPGGVTVQGTTVDAKGGPIAGAFVALSSPSAPDALARGVSDDEGSFTLFFPAGEVRASALASGYAEGVAEFVAPARGVVMVLAPGSVLVGRVVLATSDAGFSGAVVSARPVNGTLSATRAVKTATDGAFRMEGVTAGAYQLVATATELESEPVFSRVGPAAESENLTLVLEPVARVEGTLLVGESPCEHGEVQLDGPRALSANPGSGARVKFPAVPPGTYAVTAFCEDAAPGQFELSVPERGVIDTTWRLDRGHEVYGRVVTAGGQAAEGVEISLAAVHDQGLSSGRFAPNCRSGAGGNFRCGGVAPGRFRCSAGSSEDAADAVDLTVPASGPLELRLRAQGTIRAMLGTNLVAAAVTARGSDGTMRAGRSAGENTFVFTALPLDTYEVSLGEGPPQRAHLDTDAQVVTVHLDARTATLTGSVVDAGGEPVLEAWVLARTVGSAGAEGAATPVLTEDDGTFTIANVAEGNYSLSVTSPLGEAHVASVHTGQPIAITLEAYGSLSGRVLSPSGQPVRSFRLSYANGETEHIEDVSGPNGAWSAPWLAPGTYSVKVSAETGSAERQVELAPGGRVSVELTLGGPPRPGAAKAAATPDSGAHDG